LKPITPRRLPCYDADECAESEGRPQGVADAVRTADVRPGGDPGRGDADQDGVALLLGGDIITHLNDKPVDTPERLTGAMRSLHVGDTLRVTLFRRGQTQEVTLVLPERPLQPQDAVAQRSVAPLGGPRAVGRTGYRL